MRNTPGVLVLGLACICMQGCILVHTERECVCEQHDSTIHEIDAVGKLNFDSSRRSGYERIAKRQDLSDAAQVHLVNAVTKRLNFESSRVSVLMALIKNPCFSEAGETAIFRRLDRLHFDSNKARILKAISESKARRKAKAPAVEDTPAQ